MSTLGQQLRAARHAAGLSLDGVAAKGGPAKAKNSRYEHDRHVPTLATLARLTALYDCEVVIAKGKAEVRQP